MFFSLAERQDFGKDADLVFDGTLTDVRQVEEGNINAVDGGITKYNTINDAISIHGLELRWIVTFEVNKIRKGEFPHKTFKILVHSPAKSFGFLVGDIPIDKVDKMQGKYPGRGYGKKYRIYTKFTSAGRKVINKKELSEE